MKFVPCKRIRIPESAKFLLVKSVILGFGIQSTAQEIGIGNPGATDKEPRIHIWNPGSTPRGTQNARLSWIPLYGANEINKFK